MINKIILILFFILILVSVCNSNEYVYSINDDTMPKVLISENFNQDYEVIKSIKENKTILNVEIGLHDISEKEDVSYKTIIESVLSKIKFEYFEFDSIVVESNDVKFVNAYYGITFKILKY